MRVLCVCGSVDGAKTRTPRAFCSTFNVVRRDAESFDRATLTASLRELANSASLPLQGG